MLTDSSAKPTVILLMGPTASGKSDLALALAQSFPAEIVSVDSTQVYRGLDIGSAKPSEEEQAAVPHHLIDIRDPSEPYSVADFRRDALAAIDGIVARQKTPLLVGGTMLYFKALLCGLADLPAADPEVRMQIEADARAHGWPFVHAQLAEVDPDSAQRLHPNHSQRIARALEVFRVTGQTIGALQAAHVDADEVLTFRFQVIQLALSVHQRARLHANIARRFQAMLDRGLEQEVRRLIARGDLSLELPAIRAVGYRQMWEYLTDESPTNEGDYAAMVEKGIAATRQLAKRQMTWLRSWPDLCWLYTDTEQGDWLSPEEIRDRALNYIDPTTI